MSDTTSTPLHARTGWFKSSFSSPSQSCVEVRFDGDLVSVRDSKYRRDPANDLAQEPIITVTADQWGALLDEITGRATPGTNGVLSIEHSPDGTVVLRAIEDRTALIYTEVEWQKYLAGVRAGEFDHPGRDSMMVCSR
ncbi:DUF397 domain-containing protein [Saccharopolyspora phatthalungensis]|uniref:DUF397 domain-containing protein n=1 Tax=Saccharopolyspora phatthalungensis TaxID=664693 RepID=A0A840Q644_9PSEU|nr:DUF397 domain-containing protein [Saccharopolyspora phatthalungensis]MBB5155936.1 hypothetical protein [Saccharopolyspora phatthalungensis]